MENDRRRFIVGSAALGATTLWSPELLARGANISSVPEPRSFHEMVAGLYLRDRLPGLVALTFDDGPRENYTPRVLDILAIHGVTATFFVCGRRVKMRPDLLQRIVDEGHALGNHTWSHPALSRLSQRSIGEQFDRTQDAVDVALGGSNPLVYYRPPFGNPWFSRASYAQTAIRRISRQVDKRQGMIVLWQLSAGDTVRGNNKKSIIGNVRKSLAKRPGGVICMHDANVHTLRSLPDIISLIRENELAVGTLDDLIELKYGLPGTQVVDLATTLRQQRG